MISLTISIKLLLLATALILTVPSSSATKNVDNNLKHACSVTRYPALCIHSLASFSSAIKRSPLGLARAAVSVSIVEVKGANSYISSLVAGGRMRGRQRRALLDCVECFQDALDELHKSMGELRRLDRRRFEWEMSNVQTWMSAALTNEDTCLEGFPGFREKAVRSLHAKVVNASYVTSNALALVNTLASSVVSSLDGP